ncbi:hypothetical protein KKC22_02965 [Myxococcota bacterium]|nr:hypothetical protein [Myxococcota bacterium]
MSREKAEKATGAERLPAGKPTPLLVCGYPSEGIDPGSDPVSEKNKLPGSRVQKGVGSPGFGQNTVKTEEKYPINSNTSLAFGPILRQKGPIRWSLRKSEWGATEMLDNAFPFY